MQAQRQQQNVSKPFCSVCKTAGKTLSEYTNHYTRSSPNPNSPVVCPTILNAICSYCKKTGHFKSNCLVLKKRVENEETKKTVVVKKSVVNNNNNNNKTIVKKNINMFEILNDETDSKKSLKKSSKNMEFPVFITIPKKITEVETQQISYAKVASFVPEVKIAKEITVKEIEANMFSTTPSIQTKYVSPMKLKTEEKDYWISEDTNKIHKNWADDDFWSDDGDYEDE